MYSPNTRKRMQIVETELTPQDTTPSSNTSFQSVNISAVHFDQIANGLERNGYFVFDNALGIHRSAILKGMFTQLFDSCWLLLPFLEMETNFPSNVPIDEIDQHIEQNIFSDEPSTKTTPEGDTQNITETHFRTTQVLDSDDLPKGFGEDPNYKQKLNYFRYTREFLRGIATYCVIELNKRVPLLELSYNVKHNKIAYSNGGAILPKHMDNDGSNRGDLRKLTVILYLNPNWQQSHGGLLRLYSLDDTIKDIEPINDRLVFFWSDLMVHEVLPVTSPPSENRYTITLWLPTKNKNNIHEDKQLYWKLIYRHFSEYIY